VVLLDAELLAGIFNLSDNHVSISMLWQAEVCCDKLQALVWLDAASRWLPWQFRPELSCSNYNKIYVDCYLLSNQFSVKC